METELKLLENKVTQLIAHVRLLRTENQELRSSLACEQLQRHAQHRAENQQLRLSLAQAQDETRQLRENMALASTRLEALIESLPQETVDEES
jgi:uncharacterized FlaG/YvyC family protein